MNHTHFDFNGNLEIDGIVEYMGSSLEEKIRKENAERYLEERYSLSLSELEKILEEFCPERLV